MYLMIKPSRWSTSCYKTSKRFSVDFKILSEQTYLYHRAVYSVYLDMVLFTYWRLYLKHKTDEDQQNTKIRQTSPNESSNSDPHCVSAGSNSRHVIRRGRYVPPYICLLAAPKITQIRVPDLAISYFLMFNNVYKADRTEVIKAPNDWYQRT